MRLTLGDILVVTMAFAVPAAALALLFCRSLKRGLADVVKTLGVVLLAALITAAAAGSARAQDGVKGAVSAAPSPAPVTIDQVVASIDGADRLTAEQREKLGGLILNAIAIGYNRGFEAGRHDEAVAEQARRPTKRQRLAAGLAAFGDSMQQSSAQTRIPQPVAIGGSGYIAPPAQAINGSGTTFINGAGFSGTSQRIGGTTFTNLTGPNGRSVNCASQQIGSRVFTNCY